MDVSEAREHVEMIERILDASSQRLKTGGEFFIVWGIVSGTISLIWQLIAAHRASIGMLWLSGALVAAGVAFSIFRSRYWRKHGDRLTLLQREFFNVLWLGLGLAFIINLVGFNIFTAWAQSAIWSVMSAFILFYIGMHGNVRAQIGGIVLLASIAAANFTPHYAGYILAAGMYIGYAGFGVAEVLAQA